MISDRCFTSDWVRGEAQDLVIQEVILEKSIFALALVESLVNEELAFVFKGGTSLLLHLDPVRRLSIDVDIVSMEPLERLTEILNKIVGSKRFTRWIYQEHRDGDNPPTKHFRIFYESPLDKRTEGFIQLDVLFEDAVYSVIQRREIRTSFIEVDSPVLVNLPSIDCLLGDKLPRILFGNGNPAVDPKAGITAYGPAGASPQSPKQIRIGVIGTGVGIQAARAYMQSCWERVKPGLNSREKAYDVLCFPDFPGLKPSGGFQANFQISTFRDVPMEKFNLAIKPYKASDKLKGVVDLVDKQLEMLKTVEPVCDLVLIVLPKSVEDSCATIGASYMKKRAPLSAFDKLIRSFKREKEKASEKKQGLLDLDFPEPELEQPEAFWNIHHAIKAHAMKHGLPTQIVWESTLGGKNLTQDPATIAWNFFTAIYHKANNIPWQLEHLPENTCFVGISFYRSDPSKPALQTSLAQAFSGRGEGLVLQGPRTITDRRGNPVPHLSEKEAESLLTNVLKLFSDYHEIQPRRVVIHKTSRYWSEELAGFKKALQGIPRHDLVTIETVGHRFFRTGQRPPVRGTVVKLSEKHHLLYTTGYVPALSAYPGARIPMPIEILEHYGDSPIDVICQEIMALTKINWNSCNFSCREPITIQFAKSVGKILRELPQGAVPQRLYRYYM